MNLEREGLLAQRLAAMEIPMPDPVSVTEQVLARAARPSSQAGYRQRPSWRRLSAAAALLLAGTFVVSYFDPVAGQAMADAPVVGAAGLGHLAARLTNLEGSSSSAGVSMAWQGGYADASGTTLLLRVSPPALLREVDLSDQFGRHYQMQGSVSDARTGNVVVGFQPVERPASWTGARLHLHASRLEMPPGFGDRMISGDWNLYATLRVDEGRSLPTPAAGTLGEWPFRFRALRATDAFLIVDWESPGTDPSVFDRRIPDGLKGRAAFSITLIDPVGTVSSPQNGSRTGSGNSQQGIRGRSVFVRGAPGEYLLRVRYEGSGEFERKVSLPPAGRE
jgi:hypothetical protein